MEGKYEAILSYSSFLFSGKQKFGEILVVMISKRDDHVLQGSVVAT
jgi:hypothetical protein